MFFNHYPYTDFHELNLDWLMCKFKEFYVRLKNVEDAVEALKTYVDEYFDNLDITQEINDKIDQMYQDGLFSDYFIPNHFTENIVAPDPYHSASYIPSGHVANGFTSDGTRFYIASHVSDTDPVYITVIDMQSKQVINTIQTSITGHGNSLSYFNGILYVTDSTNFKCDLLDTENEYLHLGSFTLDPNCNAVWTGYLNNVRYIIGNEWNNKCISIYEVEDNYLYPMQRIALRSSPNQYVQGIDCTYNCLYLSFSYGTAKRELQILPTIVAYAWDGTELNRIYVDLMEYAGTTQYEVEDIYRDTGNDLIYFVTASGHIYSVNTAYFTTNESHHQYSAYSFRNNPFYRMAGGPNENPLYTYYSGTKLVTSMPKVKTTTRNQGLYYGIGLVAGNTAFYFTRQNVLCGYTINSNPNTSMLYAVVEYSVGTGNNITYSRGYVAELNSDGTIVVTDLQTWSTNNPTQYTVINALNHMPYDLYPLGNLVELPNQ